MILYMGVLLASIENEVAEKRLVLCVRVKTPLACSLLFTLTLHWNEKLLEIGYTQSWLFSKCCV